MPKLRDIFRPTPRPPERRIEVGPPKLDPRYLPMHMAAEQAMPELDAVEDVRRAYATTKPKGLPPEGLGRPGLRRVASVDSYDQSAFISWRRLAAPKRTEMRRRVVSRGEELRVWAIKNLAAKVLHKRWPSDHLLQLTLPLEADVAEPAHTEPQARPSLQRTQSVPLFFVGSTPNPDYGVPDDNPEFSLYVQRPRDAAHGRLPVDGQPHSQ